MFQNATEIHDMARKCRVGGLDEVAAANAVVPSLGPHGGGHGGREAVVVIHLERQG